MREENKLERSIKRFHGSSELNMALTCTDINHEVCILVKKGDLTSSKKMELRGLCVVFKNDKKSII
jgi:hypothetical protein